MPVDGGLDFKILPINTSPQRALTCFVLHGLFGQKKNWQGVAQTLVESCRSWRFVLIDLAGHGSSHDVVAETLDAHAQKLSGVALELGEEPHAIIGHSLGGKIALRYSERYASELKACVVVDSSLAAGGTIDTAIEGIFSLLEKESLVGVKSSDFRKRCAAFGLSAGLVSWLSGNARWSSTRHFEHWTLDVRSLRKTLRDYQSQDMYSYVSAPDPTLPKTTLIRAGKSTRWSSLELDRVEMASHSSMGRFECQVIPDAGHWVHVDQPEALCAMLVDLLKNSE